jgi:uncharacterized protein with PIN domain
LSTAPRFAVDAMLGRLARWLRMLGYDASYDAALADPVLVQRANAQGRVLLTRDRLLLRELKPQGAVEIRHDQPLQQLAAVVEALSLRPPHPATHFTRCLLCNTPLEAVPGGDALHLLPAGVLDVPGPVRRCPTCARVYWEGSHVRRMRDAVEQVLPGWGGFEANWRDNDGGASK